MVQREKQEKMLWKKNICSLPSKWQQSLKANASNSAQHSVDSQLPKPVACEEPKTPFHTDILQTRTQQLL